MNHTHLKRCSGITVAEYRNRHPDVEIYDKGALFDTYSRGGKHTNRANQKVALAARNRVDFAGRSKGYLTAISFVRMTTHKNGHASAVWLFRCKCGNEVERQASHVFVYVKRRDRPNESIPSCGCRISAKKLPMGESGFRATLRDYKSSAKSRNLEFSLTDDEFRKLVTEDCYYCGSAPSNFPQTGQFSRSKGVYFSGIDRVDNEVGYIIGNVVSCCQICNKMKLDWTQEQFYANVEKIYLRRIAIKEPV